MNRTLARSRRITAAAGIAASTLTAAIAAPVHATPPPTRPTVTGATVERSSSAPAAGEAIGPRHTTEQSLNWAGYVVRPRSAVTAVTGAFTVPAVRSPLPPGLASTWVGIGGDTTSDLIQAGVVEQTAGNTVTGPQYYAWYETLPAANTPLAGCHGDAACTIRPGDRIRVSIAKSTARRWRIKFTNVGHWSWSTLLSYDSSENSAEWITEAPQLVAVETPLADLGTVLFDGANTFTSVGQRAHVIRAGDPVMIVLSPGGALAEATPSTLDAEGDGFAVCTYAPSCPRPPS